jgi:Carboxypeptidase regulatory-like domain
MSRRIAQLPYVFAASILTLAVMLAATLAMAQQPLPQPIDTGSIEGTVLDITGGTVPKATVILQGANEHRTTVADDNGFFRFDGITPGLPVRLVVSASELKDWSSNEIVLQPRQDLILTDIKLAVAPVETSVTAASPEQVAAEQVKVRSNNVSLASYPTFM